MYSIFDYECGVGIRGVVPVRIVIYSLLQLLCVCVCLFVCAVPLTSSHPVIMSEALRPRKTIVSIKGLAIIGLAVIGPGGKGILQIHAHWSLYTHTQCLRNRGVLCSPVEELPSQGSLSYLALFPSPAIAYSHSTRRVPHDATWVIFSGGLCRAGCVSWGQPCKAALLHPGACPAHTQKERLIDYRFKKNTSHDIGAMNTTLTHTIAV